MAKIDEIQELNIGSAAYFREGINSNFDLIKEQWTGAYVGANFNSAIEKVGVGGLFIKVIEDNHNPTNLS